jgi:hypothetical protein
MIIRKTLRAVFYLLLVSAMCISALSLAERRTRADDGIALEAPTCCAIGADCPKSTDLCCSAAGMGAEQCMAGLTGYCRKSCN